MNVFGPGLEDLPHTFWDEIAKVFYDDQESQAALHDLQLHPFPNWGLLIFKDKTLGPEMMTTILASYDNLGLAFHLVKQERGYAGLSGGMLHVFVCCVMLPSQLKLGGRT